MALMVCITRKLKLVGLLGSFFLKKYMLSYFTRFSARSARLLAAAIL